jgi:hypothetical protein
VGTEVLKLQAKDMDKGYNGLLTFVISGGDEAVGAWDILNSGNIIMGGGSTDQASLVVRLASLKVVVSCTCNQSERMQVFAHQEALFSCAKKVFFGIWFPFLSTKKNPHQRICPPCSESPFAGIRAIYFLLLFIAGK